MFANKFKKSTLILNCDNKRTSKNKNICTVRKLVLSLVDNNIDIYAKHIPGVENNNCDLLSRQAVDGGSRKPVPRKPDSRK